MRVRPLSTPALRAAVVCVAVSMAIGALGICDAGLLFVSAHAQTKRQDPLEQARTAVETLINRLRGKDMPDGIVKTNGRIEATEVDVAAKYSGRLATVTVTEGDEVTAGQVVATISSPETEAQLRAAQAQVIKAKQALAESEAMIAERQSDQIAAKNDLQRGQELIEKGWITKQVFDQRVNKAQATDALLRAAERARDQADAAIKAAAADVERLQSILVDLVLVSPRSGRVQYRLARAGEVVSAGQRVLTILDLKDVYMTIYLSGDVAGKLMMGDEARDHRRSDSRIRLSRHHQLRRNRRPVHAKERRDRRGAPEAHVPGQAAGRPQVPGSVPSDGEDGYSRPRLRAH